MADFSVKKQYAFVIQQLTMREIKRKYARSYLGILWSVLNPLLSMAVLSLIFSQLFRRSIENYPIYYLTGYLLWQLFTGATTAAISTLTDNKSLLLKVKFPMEIFVLTRVYTALINFLYSAAAYVVMLLIFRITPKWTMLISPVIIALLFCFPWGYPIFYPLPMCFSGMSGIFTPYSSLSGCIVPPFSILQNSWKDSSELSSSSIQSMPTFILFAVSLWTEYCPADGSLLK